MPIVNGSYVAPTWVNDQAPAIDAAELNAISQTAESILLPKITITTEDSYTSMTATNGTDTITLTNYSGTWVGWFTDYGTWIVSAVSSEGTATASVEVDAVKEYTATPIPPLELMSWSDISAISQEGTAGSYWSVGDAKSVELNGTVGTLAIDATLYVFVVGINHGGVNGITFQGFKNADGKDLALTNAYNEGSVSGRLIFNANHWGNSNFGGWAGCDLRYDILGSTDVAPSGYGSAPVSGSRIGYNASSTTATNPVANTLMAALPSTLRAVMRPMTVYTDNYSGYPHDAESYVTASIDYLPLLAEFEIFGTRTNANQYEQNFQSQYEYYANGGSKVKYRHSAPDSTAAWRERSPYYTGNYRFLLVAGGNSSYNDAMYSFGLSPIFLV